MYERDARINSQTDCAEIGKRMCVCVCMARVCISGFMYVRTRCPCWLSNRLCRTWQANVCVCMFVQKLASSCVCVCVCMFLGMSMCLYCKRATSSVTLKQTVCINWYACVCVYICVCSFITSLIYIHIHTYIRIPGFVHASFQPTSRNVLHSALYHTYIRPIHIYIHIDIIFTLIFISPSGNSILCRI